MTSRPPLGFATVVQVAWGLAAVVTVALIVATIVLLMAEINARRLGRERVLSEHRQKRLIWALAVAVLALAILTVVGLASAPERSSEGPAPLGAGPSLCSSSALLW